MSRCGASTGWRARSEAARHTLDLRRDLGLRARKGSGAESEAGRQRRRGEAHTLTIGRIESYKLCEIFL